MRKIAMLFMLVPFLAAGVGCVDDDPVGPGEATVFPTGTLAVTTVTTGDDLAGNGYTLLVDGRWSRTIGANATLNITGCLGNATYHLALDGVDPNCTVSGGNLITVTARANSTTHIGFSVRCQAGPAKEAPAKS